LKIRSFKIKILFLSTPKLQIYKIQASNSDPLHHTKPKRSLLIPLVEPENQPKNTTLDTHNHTKRETRIYEVRQDVYVSGAEERDLLMITQDIQEDYYVLSRTYSIWLKPEK